MPLNDYAQLTFEFYPIRAKLTGVIATDCLGLSGNLPDEGVETKRKSPDQRPFRLVNLSPIGPVSKKQ